MPTSTAPAIEPVVKVMFRKWRDKSGGILALFPELPHDVNGFFCLSYEHTGQHGGADLSGCIRRTRKTTPEEFAGLKAELERVSYRLQVVQKSPRNAYHARRDAVKS